MAAKSNLKPHNARRIMQDDDPVLNQVAQRYAVGVTESVLDTIRHPGDPVALQYMPQAAELLTLPEESADPIGDAAHSPVPGIVHRYPDRVLFMPVNICAVYCRFCFRRENVGPGRKMLKPAEMAAALDYIRARPEIHEVILSGGDPLMLGAERIEKLLKDIQSIPHVQTLRIHTRIPVAEPPRMTDALCDALRTEKPLYILLHVNHAQELSPAVEVALKQLRAAGCILLSQSVLLRGVNDNADALETLFRRLVARGVKPYYIHHPDMAPGTSHFRLSLKEGMALMRSLRGNLSGLCLPAYMLDIPGGHGKVPADSAFVKENPDGTYTVTDFQGKTHLYP